MLLLVVELVVTLLSYAALVESECRIPTLWPYNGTSIWNTPLGSGAVWGYTSLFPQDDGPNLTPKCAPWALGVDEMVFLLASGSDPTVPWYSQGHWGPPKTPEAYCAITGALVGQLHVPFNFTSPSGGASGNPGPSVAWGGNYAVSLLQPDQETVLTTQPVYRCAPGSPWLAELPRQPGGGYSNIVKDSGNLGGHGGSGLSGLGGAIRLGEMLPGAPPIRHALQLEFYAHLFYYLPPDGSRAECFSWPATQCDGYCFSPCDKNPGCYGGTNPLLRPGALLGVPREDVPAVNASLATPPARRLLEALSTFGGYIVDDTFWNATAVTAERGVREEFKAAYGFDMNTTAAATGAAGLWYRDYLLLMRSLYVVVNNAPQTQGGGGEPLAPLPPPFC